MNQILRQFRWLSLDITAGAVVLLYFLARFLNISIPLPVAIALGSSIWIVYTIDHLGDAEAISKPSEPRRRFHRRNRDQLVLGISLVLMLNLVNLFFLPSDLYRSGFIVVGLCLVYLLGTNWLGRVGMKEVLAGIIYSTGILLYPMTMGGQPLIVFVLFLQLILLATNNLLLMSYFDDQEDRRNGFGSLVTFAGTARIKNILIGLSGSCAMVSSYLLASGVGYVEVQIFFLTSAVVLFWILIDPVRFRHKEGYRWVADGLFLLPGALFVWELVSLG